MTRALRTRIGTLVCALAVALPLPARAQPKGNPASGSPSLSSDSSPTAQNEPKTKEQLEAQQHFQRAKDLYQAGSYREAIAELEAARVLDPKAKDLAFNLGLVHEKLGRFDEAVAFFRQYMDMDGVTASERGKAESIIKRIEGAKREVTVAQEPSGPTERAAAPEDARRGRVDGATVAAGAIALVGLGVGGAFGLVALSKQPSKDLVAGRTYDDLKATTAAAHSYAIVADVGFGVGIVAAAVTAYLYFGRAKEPAKRSLIPSVVPVASGGVLLLGGAFQ